VTLLHIYIANPNPYSNADQIEMCAKLYDANDAKRRRKRSILALGECRFEGSGNVARFLRVRVMPRVRNMA